MNELKTYKDINGNEVQFQYTWRFVPYETKSRKFRVALHITPITPDYKLTSYRDVPELANLLRTELVSEYGVSSRLVPAIVIYEFDKEHPDVLGCINKVKEILRNAGIKQSKYVDLYSGFPNIFYGEEYLAYTVGDNNFSLTDVLKSMTGRSDVREQFGAMPVVGTQKFCELEDTNIDYLEDLLKNEINKLNTRVMNLRHVVKDTIRDRQVHKSLDNMYSTDKDDTWSKFQEMW